MYSEYGRFALDMVDISVWSSDFVLYFFNGCDDVNLKCLPVKMSG